MTAPTSLLTTATATAVSRSAAGFVAKAVRGFHVLRVDGYSLTKTMLPGGENISNRFVVGDRCWHVDCYPNGADRSKDSDDYISLYLRLEGRDMQRVKAEYKFSLLDAAGNPAYERPAQTSIFTAWSGLVLPEKKDQQQQELGCGHGEFISREELERRREILLMDDYLAIRCDVGFMELKVLHLGQKYDGYNYGYPGMPPHVWRGYDSDDDDDEAPRRRRNNRPQPPDDKEFIRRCLAEHRRHK